jgi:hypothetical protein
MYFAFLNGERFPFTKTDTDEEKEVVTIISPYEEFIQRLPRQDLLKDIVYPDISRSTIEERLSILVRQLSQDEKIADQDFRSAIAMIDRQMNYVSWNELRYQVLRNERDSVEKTDPTRYVQLTKRLEAKEQSGNEVIDAFVSHFLEGNMK